MSKKQLLTWHMIENLRCTYAGCWIRSTVPWRVQNLKAHEKDHFFLHSLLLLFTSICSLHGMVQPPSISGHAFLQSTLPMVLLAEAGSKSSKPQQRKARSASNLVASSAFFQPWKRQTFISNVYTYTGICVCWLSCRSPGFKSWCRPTNFRPVWSPNPSPYPA